MNVPIMLVLMLGAVVAVPCMAQNTQDNQASGCQINVTVADGKWVELPISRNNRTKADENTQRIQQIMQKAPAGAAIYFPAGDYYFHGSALPNRGTVETTQAGQIIYGDGADVTNFIQTDARQDYGFVCDAARKRVPTAVIRIRNKGCRVRSLSVLVDDKLASGIIIPSAAIQLAHIKYMPDNNIGIIETTGKGDDFLLDYVNVDNVNVGRNLKSGIQSERFFEVGVDIIGSGGEVKVYDMDRLDAKIGVRLDNGNHCGQGGYYFENLESTGRHGVTNGGVFFDWVGGQAPMLRNCNVGFTNGLHVGPLGVYGDRFEPFAEGEVVRRAGKDWDWLTLHGHAVADEPNDGQRMEWYGLPRCVERIVHVGSEPRTGGREWVEGRDFTVELVTAEGSLHQATKIHWLKNAPDANTVYYVTYQQPKEYRVHDIEWGYLINSQLGEALQAGPDGYAVKFEDQGYGYKNPDFGFKVGYGFQINNTMVLNGPMIFRGYVDYISVVNNTTGVCNYIIEGLDKQRTASRLTFTGNKMNGILMGDYVAQINIEGNETCGIVRLQAPNSADCININRNTLVSGDVAAVDLSGSIRNLRIDGNDLRMTGGFGIKLKGVTDGIISHNNLSGASQDGLVVEDCKQLIVTDNILNRNRCGLVVDAEDGCAISVRGNIISENKQAGITLQSRNGKQPKGLTLKDNQLINNPKPQVTKKR